MSSKRRIERSFEEFEDFMKQQREDIAPLLSEISREDELIPFTTLAIQKVPIQHLEKIATAFHLEIKTSARLTWFQMKELRSGEHKLQTIDLLAVAVYLQTYFPDSQVSLNVRHEFMKEYRNLELEFENEIAEQSAGTLRISPGCQLYLSQVGFPIEPLEQPRDLAKDEILKIKEFFQNAFSARRQAQGA